MIPVILSEWVLYLSFSLLMGSFILASVPADARPDITVPKKYMAMAVTAVAMFSFIPILLLMMSLQEAMGWQESVRTVLLTFEIGKAWIFTTITAAVLGGFIWIFYKERNPAYPWAGGILTIVLIAGFAWSSHAASLEQIKGAAIDAAHLITVSIWAGVLFITGWFSKNHTGWLKFLRWFTPAAAICLLVTTVSGIALMSIIMELPRYPETWTISYGQLLVLKHVLILSLLIYAVINSVLIRRRLKQDVLFSPIPWMKAESLTALLIFSVTAALGQQSPPIASTLAKGPNALFILLNQEAGLRTDVQFMITMADLPLYLIALMFSLMIFYAFLKKMPPIYTFILSILFVFTGWLAILMSIQ